MAGEKMDLLESEKIELADAIIENYFMQNFGSMSKSDLETLLFSQYFDHYIRNKAIPTDYQLSKELGITQARIRALKERKELKYPYMKNQWKNYFADAIKNAKYIESDHHIKMVIQDVNVLNEVRNHLESKGWFDEYSLNKKLLNIPLKCFVDIIVEDEEFSVLLTKESKKKLEKIQKSLGYNDNSVDSFLKDFTKDGLKSFLMSASREIIPEVLKLLPFGGIAGNAVEFLINVIKDIS